MGKSYDVIIIGAGVGGLTCGCYLAKNGLCVLILEKNNIPGGYCVSFMRAGLRFDAAAHCLGGFGDEGVLTRIWEELGINKDMHLIRSDPSDRFLLPGIEINIYSNLKKTQLEFEKFFPQEKRNIQKFFKYICESHFTDVYFSWKSKTFKDLLDSFFSDIKLKSVFNLPLGTVGIPSFRLSAIAGISLYKHFIFDGGYYPSEGMGAISNSLAKKFMSLGGTIKYQQPATKFKVTKNKIISVNSYKELYTADYFVSAMDLNTLFFELIDKEDVPALFQRTLKNMIPTRSCFLVYVSLQDYFENKEGISIWFNNNYNVDAVYENILADKFDRKSRFMLVRLNPSLGSISRTGVLLVNSPFLNSKFWKKNKRRIADKLFKEAIVIEPSLQGKVNYHDAATPVTLQNITGNSKGAMYGWAPTCAQVVKSNLGMLPFSNLLVAGHWSTEGWGFGGLMKSFMSGKLCALKIVDSFSKK